LPPLTARFHGIRDAADCRCRSFAFALPRFATLPFSLFSIDFRRLSRRRPLPMFQKLISLSFHSRRYGQAATPFIFADIAAARF
jgi:hypothetical protein